VTRHGRRGDGGALAVLVLVAAACVAIVRERSHDPTGVPHFDIYAYLYPNVRHAIASLADGHGLFWNRLQNCGEPFFGISITALLYPFNALYFWLDFPTALLALLFVHLVIGALAMYALGRAAELGPVAALAGALVFELGANTLWLALWSPHALAFYVWMPAALAAVERLLRRPTGGTAALLGAALACQWLTGYPQASLFTHQVIALRLVFEAATAWRSTWRRAAALIVVAIVAAPLVAAVQLVPAFEVASQSLRSHPLTMAEIRLPALTITWIGFREFVGRRYSYGALFGVAALMATTLAWAAPPRARRVALFYLLVAALSFALVFDTPLFALYRALPLGSTFREPHRFFWVTGFAGSVVVACGVEGLASSAARGAWTVLRVVFPVAVAAVFHWLAPNGLQRNEVILGLVLLTLAVLPPSALVRRLVAVVVPLVLLVELYGASTHQIFRYLTDQTMVMQHEKAFAAARARMTFQDRLYSVPGAIASRWQGLNDGLVKKAGQLFRVPSIVDYEPLTSERYAELLVFMLYGRPMTTINEFLYDLRWVPTNRRLFDLTSARFVVIDAARADELAWPGGDAYTLAWERDGQRIYENHDALPRAYWVPQVRVVGDANSVLGALAIGTDDPRRIAFVEGTPSAPVGQADGEGRAEIVSDRSETVEVRVRANAPGYLVLADQYYPGWEATVNGKPVAVQRANFAFRLVEVPAGEALVVFRYRPRSVVVGAEISAATLLALVVLGVWSRVRAA
jgi:hypothetical protein